MKNDLRTVKTRRAINSAFMELLEEVGFSKLNVRMMIERAEINRSTFYLHYLDKYDLLEKFEASILSGIASIAEEAPIEYITRHSHDEQSLSLYAGKMTEYLLANGKAFSLLMSEKGDPAFIHKISEAVSNIWDKNQVPRQLSVSPDYTKAALIGSITYLISQWVKNGFDLTKEEFSAMILTFTHSILETVLAE